MLPIDHASWLFKIGTKAPDTLCPSCLPTNNTALSKNKINTHKNVWIDEEDGRRVPHVSKYECLSGKTPQALRQKMSVAADVPECLKYQDGSHIILHRGSCVRCGLSVQTRRLSVEPEAPAESSEAGSVDVRQVTWGARVQVRG